jgi:hypothetical protein
VRGTHPNLFEPLEPFFALALPLPAASDLSSLKRKRRSNFSQEWSCWKSWCGLKKVNEKAVTTTCLRRSLLCPERVSLVLAPSSSDVSRESVWTLWESQDCHRGRESEERVPPEAEDGRIVSIGHKPEGVVLISLSPHLLEELDSLGLITE